MKKNTGKVRERSGNFVSPEKWEPWLTDADDLIMRMAQYEQQTMNPSQIDVAFVFAFIQLNCTLRLIYTEEKRFHFLSSLSLLNVNIKLDSL